MYFILMINGAKIERIATHSVMLIDWQEAPLNQSAPCSVLVTVVNNHKTLT